MYRTGLLIALLLLFALLPFGQRSTHPADYKADYAAAEKLFKSENANDSTDSLAMLYYQKVAGTLNQSKKFNAVLVDAYLKSGILQMSQKNHDKALVFFQRAVEAWKKGIGLSDTLLFAPYLYTGSIRSERNELDSALHYYKMAERISNQFPGIQSSERLYNKMGYLFYEANDYRRSITYYEKALSMVTPNNPNQVYFLVNYKNNIATSLLKLGAYQQALDIYKALLAYKVNLDQLYSNIAKIYFESGNLEAALNNYRMVKEKSPEHFNHLTEVYLKMNQLDSAIFYNSKSIAVWDLEKDKKGIDFTLTLKNAGDIKCRQGDYLNGISHYQQALRSMLPDFSDTALQANPASFSGLLSFTYLFDVLTAKAAAYHQQNCKTPGHSYNNYALDAYASALALAHYVERTYSSDDARLFLKNKVNPACSEAVALALQLFEETGKPSWVAAAFGFAENNKASVLQAGIQLPDLSAMAGIPNGLIAEEKNYKIRLARFYIQQAQLRDSGALKAGLQKIRETELQLSDVQRKLDENAAYHRLKFNAKQTDLEKIQEALKHQEEAVVSYYYTDSILRCFYITGETSGVVSSKINHDFFDHISTLRKELETTTNADRKKIKSTAQELYQVLLQPVIDKFVNKRHLTIIPYNEISYLPFELLQDASGTSLLNKYAISYQYSANFLFDNAVEKKGAYQVLAMAPFSGNASGGVLPSLPASAAEIAGLPGKLLTGKEASKAQFIQYCSQYPVIHLATHAIANFKDSIGSYIEFYGNTGQADSLHRLYDKEIYNLDLSKTKLVILSACETGNGLLVNGEGIVSLSRAFSYAGCKSVITSLWKADDIATAFIMNRLHYYLQKGIAKDIALQSAKLDYINNPSISDQYKTPFYWAHLELIGDALPVQPSGFNGWWLMVVGLVIGILAFWYKKTGYKLMYPVWHHRL